jgi:2-polyprenyl-6-methoxyphenol hydroxylase-like FAD-dependent oxidoreductase
VGISSTCRQDTSYDVAVIGGGPAGCSTALALTQRGYRCLIVERSGYDEIRVGETLPPATCRLLSHLGIWDRFLDANANPAHVIAVSWGENRTRENSSIFDPYGPGWHVDRRRFDRLLAQAATEAGITLAQGTRICFRRIDGRAVWRLSFVAGAREREESARILVDATGRSAVIARRMGARRITVDRLVGLTAFFCLSHSNDPHDTTMLVEAVENGWWYSAVLPDQRIVVAYLTDADLLADRSGTLPVRFLNQLRQASRTSSRLRGYELDYGPLVSSANSSLLDRMCGDNWIAVGDAATSFDPLASQGVYRALESGLKAAEAIEEYWTRSRKALEDYERSQMSQYERYLIQRHEVYRRECRWPEHEFWRRRQQDAWETGTDGPLL